MPASFSSFFHKVAGGVKKVLIQLLETVYRFSSKRKQAYFMKKNVLKLYKYLLKITVASAEIFYLSCSHASLTSSVTSFILTLNCRKQTNSETVVVVLPLTDFATKHIPNRN